MQIEGRTMADVQAVIEARRGELEKNPFLSALDASSEAADVRAIAPHLYFYVLGFQDMLRMTHELVREPAIKAIASQLAAEDAGHEQWYLYDIEQLDCARDLRWLFSAEHQPVRDIVYMLMAQLLRADDDRVRIVFPLVLEAAGSVFFKRVVGLLRRADYQRPLRYFARSHQEVEEEHDIFSEDGQLALTAIEFDATSYRDALGLISSCFDAFEGLADHLEHQRGEQRGAA